MCIITLSWTQIKHNSTIFINYDYLQNLNHHLLKDGPKLCYEIQVPIPSRNEIKQKWISFYQIQSLIVTGYFILLYFAIDHFLSFDDMQSIYKIWKLSWDAGMEYLFRNTTKNANPVLKSAFTYLSYLSLKIGCKRQPYVPISGC